MSNSIIMLLLPLHAVEVLHVDSAPCLQNSPVTLSLTKRFPLRSSPNGTQDCQASTSEAIRAGKASSWINSCYLDRAHTTTNESSGSQYSCAAVAETTGALFNTDNHTGIGEDNSCI